MKKIILLISVWMLLQWLPFSAQAISVTKSAVRFNPNKSDSFQIAGNVENLSLDQVEQLRIDVGSFTQSIPLSAFKKTKEIYQFTGAKGGVGLARLVINLKRGTFLAKGQNMLLSGFKNPLTVRLVAGTFDECTMLSNTVSKNGSWLFNAKDNTQSSCSISDVPTAEPSVFFSGATQNVRVQARVGSDPALDMNSVELVEVDPLTHAPTVELLCRLSDDGNAANGDDAAGDHVFACIKPFNEASARKILLTVRARMSGVVVYSPQFLLEATTPYSAEAAGEAANAQQAAVAIWNEQLAASGYGNKARKNTLKQVQKLPGVAKAGVSPDGYTIWINYASGLTGGLLLNPPGTRGGAGAPQGQDSNVTPRADESTGNLPASFPRYTKLIPGLRPNLDSLPAAGLSFSDHRVGNNKVLIWDAYHSDLAPFDEGPALQQLYQASQCPKFEVTYLQDEQATLASVRSFADYGTVVLVTHGALDSDGQAMFLTRETIDADAILQYAGELALGRLTMIGDVFAIRPGFIDNLPGNFEGSVIYNGSCQSLANSSMANAFLGKGANTYFGFSRVVNSDFANNVATQLFSGLVTNPRNSGDAFSPVFPKTDLNAPFAALLQRGDYHTIYNGQFRNGDFETGDLTAWQRSGDSRVISGLGEYDANGYFLGLISTGLGLSNQAGVIEQNFCLPAKTTQLKFNWNLSSEKFKDLCQAQPDAFDIELVDASGAHNLFHKTVGALCASPSLELSGLHFDQGSGRNVWSTGWMSESIDISSYAIANNGSGVKLRFKTVAGGSNYDSATLVDDIELVGQ